jgi:hypothetical protein
MGSLVTVHLDHVLFVTSKELPITGRGVLTLDERSSGVACVGGQDLALGGGHISSSRRYQLNSVTTVGNESAIAYLRRRAIYSCLFGLPRLGSSRMWSSPNLEFVDEYNSVPISSITLGMAIASYGAFIALA